MELSTALKFTFPNAYAVDSKTRWLLPYAELTTRIVVTDQIAPNSVQKWDVSEAQDGGVVRWRDGDTYYISTQRAGVKVTAPEDCKFLFANLEKLETFDGTMLDTSQTINMSNMFDGCDFLVEITGLQNWDVSKVENMRSMFAFCEKLDDVSSLAHWNVSSVKDMAQMFFLL